MRESVWELETKKERIKHKRKENMQIHKILIVDDHDDFRNALKELLEDEFLKQGQKLKITGAKTEGAAIVVLKENPDIKVTLLDYVMEHENSGQRIFNFIKEKEKHKTRIIYLTGAVREADQKIIEKRDTVDDYINKNPLDIDKITTSINRRLTTYEELENCEIKANTACEEVEKLKTKFRREIEYIMGKGKAISKVLDIVEKYAKEEDVRILLTGETGVGKEEIAKYLHNNSNRRNCKFVSVNCSSLTENIADSILFGVIAKFPGFHNERELIGAFEEAEGGTLFLDEIHALDEKVQDKLLRVLQSEKFARLGEPPESRIANVRVICASNLIEKNLENFREAFIGRIVEKKIDIPPLRERYEDIPFFIDRFISEENKKRNKFVFLSDEARKLLINHDWKLNVRGLMSTIKSLVIEVDVDKKLNRYIIKQELVKSCLEEQNLQPKTNLLNNDFTWETAQNIAMKKAIERALKAGGTHDRAFKLLEIAKGTYYEWRKKLGMMNGIKS